MSEKISGFIRNTNKLVGNIDRPTALCGTIKSANALTGTLKGQIIKEHSSAILFVDSLPENKSSDVIYLLRR